MICNRCKRENPPNAIKCIYCGQQLQNVGEKKSESAIVVLIIIMVIALLAIAGVAIYNSNGGHRKGGYAGGGGGGGELPPWVETEKPDYTERPTEKPTDKPTPTPTPKPTEKPTESSSKQSMKDYFYSRAAGIEEYAREYLDTANTQNDINRESGIVYTKWDSLLNDVYLHLKGTMSESEFRKLTTDEQNWIKTKEEAMDIAGKEFEGGSGETMARNMTGISYTKDRCYYLISLVK